MDCGTAFEPVDPACPIMSFHPEVMPFGQQEVLRVLGPVATGRDFYLGGRTAVAIHLGHRRSVDLDWFTSDAIPPRSGAFA